MLAARDPARPAIATDTLGTHYSLTRDRSMMDQDGDLERYSYKDVYAMAKPTTLPQPYRGPISRYRTHIIGQVHDHRAIYEDNPLHGEVSLFSCKIHISYLQQGFGCKCFCYALKCPQGADEDTVSFFEQQIAKLKHVVEDKLQTVSSTNIYLNLSSQLSLSQEGSSIIG
jgi:hypothetical protein